MRYLITATFPVETPNHQPSTPDQIAAGVETAIMGAASNLRAMLWQTPSGTSFHFGHNAQVVKIERVTPDERR